jgi:uncharacterized protein involved in exopolysaccharide biosynthesis/Mrp family chromosome partitioning ATPase
MLVVPGDKRRTDRAIEPVRPRLSEHDAHDARDAGTPPIAHEPTFYELAGILYRRRRMILTVAALGTSLAAVVGLLIPPKYTAIASIAVQPQQGATDVRSFSPTDESPIDTQVAMLSSRDHLDRVLDSLSQDPTFPSAAFPQRPESGATAADSARKVVSQTAGAENPTAPMTTEPGPLNLGELSRRLKIWMRVSNRGGANVLNAEQLARDLNVMQERRSRIVTVRVTSKSPQQAATIANRIVQVYVDNQLEQKQMYLSQELARIGERIAELKKEVESARTTARTLVDQRFSAGQTGNRERREPDARLSEFARDATTGTQLQINLLRRQEDLRGQLEFITPDVTVNSLAPVPERPSSPNPILFVLPALLVCAICAGLLAVVLERFDRKLRSERDINDVLGIPCIGLVPQLPRKRKNRPCEYLVAKPLSAYADAIRSIVATLQLTTPQRASKVVLISSSVPLEGKSTLALSLAAYVARLGRRVVVADFDLRQRSILGELGASTKRRVLDPQVQDPPVAEFIRHVSNLGLDYLAVPCSRVDPLAPFAHQQIQRLLRQLREAYDCVIIDGPPLLGIAESRLLSPLADKILLVVKWGSTRREVAQNALRQLRDAGCLDKEWSERPTAVVTQVELEKHARYQFGDTGELLAKYRDYYSRSSA